LHGRRREYHGDTNGLGHQIVQKRESLRVVLTREKIDPGQISTRLGEAANKAELNRVFADTKDDWDHRGRSLGHLSSVIARGSGDNGHTTTHEVSHDRRKAVEFAF
jgi:hypothetical protein